MLASKFLTKKNVKHNIVKKFEKLFLSLSSFYKDTLGVVINKTRLIGIFIIFIIFVSAFLFNFSIKELLTLEARVV